MKVSIFSPIKEDPFFSIRVYAANLIPALVEQGVDVDEVTFSRRHQGWMPGPLNGPLNRYLLHPAHAARRQGTVNHVLDHAYGHLVFALDRRRTVVSCNTMSIPKALAGTIPGFRVPPTLRATTWLRHAGLLRCARIVACSHALKQDIVAHLGCDPSSVTVVQDGINHEIFRRRADDGHLRDLIAPFGLAPGGERMLLSVSTLSEDYKNRIAALQAQHVLLRRGHHVTLVLVGAALSAREARFIAEHALDPHVRWLGRIPLEVLVALYNLADAFIFPSWDEGFGYPPLEAMACGLPVVVSTIPVLAETTGGAALTAPPDDPTQFADRIEQIFTDPALALALREAGIRQAQAYSWRRYATEITAVYRDVQAGSGAA